jgi:hypothetical protein
VFSALIELVKAWALRHKGTQVSVTAKDGDGELVVVFSPDRQPSPRQVACLATRLRKVLRPDGTPHPQAR